jgi:hypothetical protein
MLMLCMIFLEKLLQIFGVIAYFVCLIVVIIILIGFPVPKVEYWKSWKALRSIYRTDCVSVVTHARIYRVATTVVH